MSKAAKLALFVLVPILLTSAGEFLLKKAINGLQISPHLSSIVPLISNPTLLFAIFMIVIGGILWLIAMSKFQISYIYPFLSLNYLIIFLGSGFILNEQIPKERIFALSLIILGLIIISKSPHLEK